MSENSSQDERISSMALQRKAYDDFLKWKSAPDRRALLVTGARQVGKTYLIREFGRNEYEVFLEINFIETPKAREIFEGDLDADTLVANLTAFTKVPLVPGQTLELVRERMRNREPIPTAIHERLLRAFSLYMVVGGMPAAVERFNETSDLSHVLAVQQDIVDLYRQDIAKYGDDRPHIKMIFDAIPEELDKKNKRFKLSDLAKSARMERYASDFMWVADAGVGLPCYNVKAPELPLSLNTQHNLFKLFLCDVGLLSAQTSGDARFDLLQGNLAVNWGSMLENAIAQELTAHGFDLRYFDKAKYGEVDFVIEKGSKALPIEAKSGKDYEKHKALDNVMAVREWGIDSAIVFCRGNVREEGKVLYLPWYAVMFIEKERGPQKIDLAEFLG